MGAVVLRKNLSKCVISPLMEHRGKAILLIPPFSCSFGLFPHSLPPLLFMLFDVSISLPALHLSTLPSFERVTFLTHRFGRSDCGCISAPVLTEGICACALIHVAKTFHQQSEDLNSGLVEKEEVFVNNNFLSVNRILPFCIRFSNVTLSVCIDKYVPFEVHVGASLTSARPCSSPRPGLSQMNTFISCRPDVNSGQRQSRGITLSSSPFFCTRENKWGTELNGAALLMCKR